MSENNTPTRDELLAQLRSVRETAAYKAFRERDGRIRDTEKAGVRIRYLRVLVQAAAEERKLLKDRDLEELAERVEALERDEPEVTV